MKALFDIVPVVIFFVAYKVAGIIVATGVFMVAMLAVIGWQYSRTRRIEAMHVIVLVAVLVFGGATIIWKDSAFIMWKPTVVYWIFAGVLLVTQFRKTTAMQYLMSSQLELPGPVWKRLNLAWMLFFLAMGVLNLYVAFYYAPEMDAAAREDMWVNFKLFGTLGLTFAFAIGQAFYLARYMPEKEGTD
ncbi:MAG: septation protein A [Gammaproteobacteria bacterium]|nr:septation protein A [Gammaproteobacteria bacterium]